MTNKKYLENYLANLSANEAAGVFQRENVFDLSSLLTYFRKNIECLIFINPSPSLETNIDELKTFLEDKEKVNLICSDVCLPGLYAKGIMPDFVVSIDPSEKTQYFFKDIPGDYSIITSSASNVTNFGGVSNKIYLFNAVEENDSYRVPYFTGEETNTVLKEAYDEAHNKANTIATYLNDFGIRRRYLSLISRGTVFITMLQIGIKAKTHCGFYGCQLNVQRHKPYASFISEANFAHFSKVYPGFRDLVSSVEDYNHRIMISYFNGKDDYDKYWPESGGEKSLVAPPLLEAYQKFVLDYSQVDPFLQDKTVTFH
jgi:hypothetical protein